MGTFADLKSQIADDLSRTSLTSQINTAVLDAVTYYERQRFYFNETRALTFATVLDQEFYGSADAAAIPNLLDIDGIKITISANDIYALSPRTNDDLESISQNATLDRGQPTWFAYYNQQIRLYPIPNAIYTCRVWGVQSLTALSADSDTNAWTTDAKDLIRTRAKWDLYTHVIRNFEEADRMAQAEAVALESLRDATLKRALSGGTIIATAF